METTDKVYCLAKIAKSYVLCESYSKKVRLRYLVLILIVISKVENSTFTPAKIVGVLIEFARGRSAEELAKENGISTAALYNSWQKYARRPIINVYIFASLEE